MVKGMNISKELVFESGDTPYTMDKERLLPYLEKRENEGKYSIASCLFRVEP